MWHAFYRRRMAQNERMLDRKFAREIEHRASVRSAWWDMGSPQPGTCDRSSGGWFCALEKDHDGPCPAWPEWVRS